MAYGHEFNYMLKIILIGDSGVGKSNILSRFTRNEFCIDSTSTDGAGCATRTLQIEGKTVHAEVWDSSFQNGGRNCDLGHAYYRGVVGALLVYDITKRQSFENVQWWLKELREHADSDIVIMIAGNKCDLHYLRAVSDRDGRSLADEEGLFFLEISALEDFNIDRAFSTIITTYISRIDI